MQQMVEPSRAFPEASPGLDSVFPYERWMSRAPQLAAEFAKGDPFPYVVLEEFLEPAVAEACLREFPRPDDATWNNYVHVNERKHGKSDQRTFPPTIQAVTRELNSARFLRF